MRTTYLSAYYNVFVLQLFELFHGGDHCCQKRNDYFVRFYFSPCEKKFVFLSLSLYFLPKLFENLDNCLTFSWRLSLLPLQINRFNSRNKERRSLHYNQ